MSNELRYYIKPLMISGKRNKFIVDIMVAGYCIGIIPVHFK